MVVGISLSITAFRSFGDSLSDDLHKRILVKLPIIYPI